VFAAPMPSYAARSRAWPCALCGAPGRFDLLIAASGLLPQLTLRHRKVPNSKSIVGKVPAKLVSAALRARVVVPAVEHPASPAHS